MKIYSTCTATPKKLKLWNKDAFTSFKLYAYWIRIQEDFAIRCLEIRCTHNADLFLFLLQQLLYQNDEPQIMYSYLLPRDYPNRQTQRGQQAQQPAEPAPIGHRGLVTQPTQPTSNSKAHAWRLTRFTQCTHSCAGGSTSANHFHLTWIGTSDNNFINLTCYVARF